MSSSDAPPTDALNQASIVVQPHTITLRDSNAMFEHKVTMSECLAEGDPIRSLLFAQVLLMSDMAKALRTMASAIEESRSNVESHKQDAQETLDATLNRVVKFMSSMQGMDQTIITQMVNTLRPPSGGDPA